jgi:hypothetical protein
VLFAGQPVLMKHHPVARLDHSVANVFVSKALCDALDPALYSVTGHLLRHRQPPKETKSSQSL